MPSKFFRGGLDAMYAGADQWTNDANLKCSAVAGTQIITSSVGWQNLSEFLGPNSLVGTEAAVPAAPDRGSLWNGGSSSIEFWFNNPLSFGTITNGQTVAGIVFYSGSSATPATSPLWLCSEHAGGFYTSDGGIISVGTNTQNIAGRWSALVTSNRYTFWGTLELHNNVAGAWGDAGWRVGYALVRSTTTSTPSRTWRLMSDLPAGVQYCTGANPGATNMPESLLASREGPEIALNNDADSYEFGIRSILDGRTTITWPNADLVATETIVAVIAFAYQGTYNAATAWILHWDDVPDHAIVPAQNITYASDGAFTMNYGVL